MAYDETDHLLICKRIFERSKYQVRTLSCCFPLPDFAAKVRQIHPDLIFIDHEMPGPWGNEGIRELKGQPDLRLIPIIYFSAQSNLESLANQAGADGYIKKPFNIDELLAIAQKYVKLPAA